MFTGIIEETGTVVKIKQAKKSIELTVSAKVCGKRTRVGDSVAVNGCCLTVVDAKSKGSSKLLRFDLLRETWERTNLQFAEEGGPVNLERPLRANGQLGGHFVTGHIDGVGKVMRWEQAGKDWVLDISVPREVAKYIVFKGSVAVDGISLTVAAIIDGGFRVWIIPHTYEVTALKARKEGSAVNLEADIIGKYVEQFVSARSAK